MYYNTQSNVKIETFIEYLLLDKKIHLASLIKNVFNREYIGLEKKIHEDTKKFLEKTIYAFEVYGEYLNNIPIKSWLDVKDKIERVLYPYEENYENSLYCKPKKDPQIKINRAISNAKKVIKDLALPDDLCIYSDDGKTYKDNKGRVKKVAQSAIDRVLFSKLLYKYIKDLENKDFKISDYGNYYVNYKISKQNIKNVFYEIRQEYKLPSASADEKELINHL